MTIKTKITSLCVSPVKNVFYINQNNTIEKWYVDMVINKDNMTYTPPSSINDDYNKGMPCER